MHKILEMGRMGYTDALYICDRQPCTNTWQGHPNERVNIGNRDFDLCQSCLAELGSWFGEVPWDMMDHPARKIRYNALPQAREMLSQVAEMLNHLEGEHAALERGAEVDAELTTMQRSVATRLTGRRSATVPASSSRGDADAPAKEVRDPAGGTSEE